MMIELEKERRKDLPVPSKVNVGLMIEVPAIVFQLEDVLKQADFISIGTNDLAQFTFACVRLWLPFSETLFEENRKKYCGSDFVACQ